MARDDAARETDSGQSLLDRRSYLKMAGAAAASVAAVGASTTTSADESSYETITVPAGETEVFELGDGETFENKLIDITADGASAQIDARANDWTVRNVGFKGVHPGGNYLMLASVPNASSTGVVENVYMGDGQVEGSGEGGIFVHYAPEHNGEITFKRMNVARMVDNGLYASAPGHHGQQGLVHVEDSYFESNNIANVRLGTAAGTSTVTNTTVYVDEEVPACDVGCSVSGAVNARGVWAWKGPVELVDCDIQTNDHGSNLETRDGGDISQSDTRLEDAADTAPPEAAPMSAEEAASGNRNTADDSTGDETADDTAADDDSPSLPNVIVVDGSNRPSALSRYEFSVSGDIEKDGEYGSVNAYDSVSGDTAEGRIVGGKDAFRYSGSITDFRLQGAAVVEVHDDVY